MDDGRATWLVAVDDDPTRCQSVSGVPLLASWDADTLAAAARRRAPVTFVLTNSRSMTEDEAVRVNTEVGAALAHAAAAEGVALRLISRSDSTLRGHFPAEVTALAPGAGLTPDGIVICPAFFEAGRYTAEGIHWVHRGGEMVAACDTEFARDASFGFTELTLADWARTRGAPVEVVDISLGELAVADIDAVAARLAAVSCGQAVVVNAVNYAQLQTFDAAERRAETSGAALVYRTGPSFVRAAAGLGPPALADLGPTGGSHGLVVVGSHTAVTNAQVEVAVERHGLELVELDAGAVLDETEGRQHVVSAAAAVADALGRCSVVLRTSRTLITSDGARTPLQIGRVVADAVTATVRAVASAAPLGWVVAKGGITSHDLLTTAFEVRTAEVRGQALPGIVPVLDISVAGRSIPYVIFPGNVGDDRTLALVLDRLIGS